MDSKQLEDLHSLCNCSFFECGPDRGSHFGPLVGRTAPSSARRPTSGDAPAVDLFGADLVGGSAFEGLGKLCSPIVRYIASIAGDIVDLQCVGGVRSPTFC